MFYGGVPLSRFCQSYYVRFVTNPFVFSRRLNFSKSFSTCTRKHGKDFARPYQFKHNGTDVCHILVVKFPHDSPVPGNLPIAPVHKHVFFTSIVYYMIPKKLYGPLYSTVDEYNAALRFIDF